MDNYSYNTTRTIYSQYKSRNFLKGQRRAKRPEGADQKSMLPRKTRANNRTSDSCISPSGLLERLVLMRLLLAQIILANPIASEPERHHRPCVGGTMIDN